MSMRMHMLPCMYACMLACGYNNEYHWIDISACIIVPMHVFIEWMYTQLYVYIQIGMYVCSLLVKTRHICRIYGSSAATDVRQHVINRVNSWTRQCVHEQLIHGIAYRQTNTRTHTYVQTHTNTLVCRVAGPLGQKVCILLHLFNCALYTHEANTFQLHIWLQSYYVYYDYKHTCGQ